MSVLWPPVQQTFGIAIAPCSGKGHSVAQSVQQLGYGMGYQGNWVLTPAKVRDFLSCSKYPDRRWGSSSFVFNGCQRAQYSGVKVARAVKLKTQLRLVPRLRTSGALLRSPIRHNAVYKEFTFICTLTAKWLTKMRIRTKWELQISHAQSAVCGIKWSGKCGYHCRLAMRLVSV